jgi:hypothetical protein
MNELSISLPRLPDSDSKPIIKLVRDKYASPYTGTPLVNMVVPHINVNAPRLLERHVLTWFDVFFEKLNEDVFLIILGHIGDISEGGYLLASANIAMLAAHEANLFLSSFFWLRDIFLTNATADYLICIDEYNTLKAWGAALDWVQERKREFWSLLNIDIDALSLDDIKPRYEILEHGRSVVVYFGQENNLKTSKSHKVTFTECNNVLINFGYRDYLRLNDMFVGPKSGLGRKENIFYIDAGAFTLYLEYHSVSVEVDS